MAINKYSFFSLFLSASLLLTPLALFTPLAHASDCSPWVAMAISVQGDVERRVINNEQTVWQVVKSGEKFCSKDVLRVRQNSRAALVLTNDTIVRLDENTTITFSNLSPDSASSLDLKEGIAHFISRVKQLFKVITPFVNASIEGTEFVVTVAPDQAEVTVFEGVVRAENDKGQVVLKQGQTAVAMKDQAPVLKTLVKPRDAVQWALYYPVILQEGDIDPKLPDEIRNTLAQSMIMNKNGNASGAATVMDAIPNDLQDANVYSYRAALRLAVGRVTKASEDIERAFKIKNTDSNALALKSIIAVVQNQRENAQSLAQQAIDSDPQNASAYLALSYAKQAQFDLEAAQNAMADAPVSSLVHARRAELYLMERDLDGALNEARKATELHFDSAHAQRVLGFAYLLEIHIIEARNAFERAIKLEPSNPLAHLGLGLAIIRSGDLAEGRREIEYAASLDPNNSLIRSYLGKAYYEENRNKVATDQFDMAKALDPKDPTPWFYDATLKHSENNPIGAMQDLENSIELNENRQVYRSKLLLDQDLASRSVGQAQIYKTLGFDQQARTLASNSITESPNNYAAHQFLANIYSSLPDHGIAQASELLQAQMLQPVNSTPIHPQMAEYDLAIFGTNSLLASAFNEYSSLFHRDGVNASANAQAGNNNTFSDEIIISGSDDKFSYSVGRFLYDTDGYRDNNDNLEEIYNIFLQYAFTHNVSLQTEFRSRETDQGDINQNFDLTMFSADKRRTFDHDTKRLGLHITPSNQSDILISYLQSDMDEKTHQFESGTFIDTDIDRSGDQAETQYQFNASKYNFVTGLGSYHVDADNTILFDWTPTFGSACPPSPPFPPVPCIDIQNFKTTHNTGYAYFNTRFPESVMWTLGASYDDVKKESAEIHEANPKFGIQWQLPKSQRIRLAYFEAVKRELLVEQTLEPTQVAGFNQFYDDINASKFRLSGIGYDGAFGTRVLFGLETIKRSIDKAQFYSGEFIFQDRDKTISNIYVNFLASSSFMYSVSATRDNTRNKDPADPYQIVTTTLPLKVKYFHKSRWFTEIVVTHIEQSRKISSGSSTDSENFKLVDASVGYRLPNRLGSLGIDIFNIADEKFSYQDSNYVTSMPVKPQYMPERTILCRILLNLD